MAKSNICKKCHRSIGEHCIFEPIEIPAGCVCDVGTWGGKIEPICDKYVGGGNDEYCQECEHDKACHKEG